MRIYVIAAAAALLLPSVANAQDRTFRMPRGYEEVVPPEPPAVALYGAARESRSETIRVTPVASRPNLRIDEPAVAVPIPEGQQRFVRGVACSSEFQVRQISQGLAAAATTPNRTRRAMERSRQVAIDHQVDMGVCERFENRVYTVVGTGVFDRNDGAAIPYVEVERTPQDEPIRVTDFDRANRVYLIFAAQ